VLPATLTDYLAAAPFEPIDASHPAAHEAAEAVRARIETLLSIDGDRTVHSFHRELGAILWDHCGMERTQAGLIDAIKRVRELKRQFWRSVKVTGENAQLNQTLERAGRVADFFELAELMCIDALHREESCGCHFRVEYQTAEGEALRNDDRFAYVAAWEFTGAGRPPVLHPEYLEYGYVEMKQRSYQ
jgi:succinate dehydrogenase / fumarate reductase, flavoprotein subunit